MILGLGCDIIEVKRIEGSITAHSNRFLDRLFTEKEQAYCLKYVDSSRHFAGRFAAKESIVKALGVGISHEIGWLDMEILNNEQGKPTVTFSERAQAVFGFPVIQLTISHCKEYAMAVAILL